MSWRTAGLQLTLVALACATAPSPAVRLEQQAAEQGFERLVLEGGGFHHVAYARNWQGPVRELHVYLEGDGVPWIAEGRVAADPHPRHALAFELAGLDPSPSLYLGRPCYNRWRTVDDCDPLLWTLARYSPRVVGAMEQALFSALAERPVERIVLVGYSGGGVLAMLLAERLPGVKAVVTVAANLDVAAWVELHGYTPLLGSLDPACRPPLGAAIQQLHLVGERDQEVPPALVAELGERPGAELLRFSEFDHRCCWSEAWPEVLARLLGPPGTL